MGNWRNLNKLRVIEDAGAGVSNERFGFPLDPLEQLFQLLLILPGQCVHRRVPRVHKGQNVARHSVVVVARFS